ncbi:MAG: HNH endonuclease [Lachnospiraceae bacterium]|nr:HNH endonuclease [Lachnospiraceae bacterium]
MPRSPLRPCRFPGCPNLCKTGTYCDVHNKDNSSDAWRGSSTERGYDGRWRKARDRFLRLHPLCVECLKEDKYTPATVVDHIIPHRGDQKLFWDENNWQALCKKHHDEKTGHGL